MAKFLNSQEDLSKNKTKNCVSIILVFAVKEEEKEDLIELMPNQEFTAEYSVEFF